MDWDSEAVWYKSVLPLQGVLVTRSLFSELDYPKFLKLLDEKVRFYEIVLERIFQLKKGSFDLRPSYLKIYKQEE